MLQSPFFFSILDDPLGDCPAVGKPHTRRPDEARRIAAELDRLYAGCPLGKGRGADKTIVRDRVAARVVIEVRPLVHFFRAGFGRDGPIPIVLETSDAVRTHHAHYLLA